MTPVVHGACRLALEDATVALRHVLDGEHRSEHDVIPLEEEVCRVVVRVLHPVAQGVPLTGKSPSSGAPPPLSHAFWSTAVPAELGHLCAERVDLFAPLFDMLLRLAQQFAMPTGGVVIGVERAAPGVERDDRFASSFRVWIRKRVSSKPRKEMERLHRLVPPQLTVLEQVFLSGEALNDLRSVARTYRPARLHGAPEEHVCVAAFSPASERRRGEEDLRHGSSVWILLAEVRLLKHNHLRPRPLE